MKNLRIPLFVWLLCLPFSLLAQIPEQGFGANTALRTEAEVAQIADN